MEGLDKGGQLVRGRKLSGGVGPTWRHLTTDPSVLENLPGHNRELLACIEKILRLALDTTFRRYM